MHAQDVSAAAGDGTTSNAVAAAPSKVGTQGGPAAAGATFPPASIVSSSSGLSGADEKGATFVEVSSSVEEHQMVEEESAEDSEHADACEVCDLGGDLLLCDTCTDVYHVNCLDPPL